MNNIPQDIIDDAKQAGFVVFHAPNIGVGLESFDAGENVTAELVKFAELRAKRVPEGYKLLKDTTLEERSWDDSAQENGNYMNTCCVCLRQFMGHKRRVVCRVCAKGEPE